MSELAPVPIEELTPEEREDPRLARHLERVALERAATAMYTRLLPVWGWELALTMVTEALPISRSKLEKLVWGGSARRVRRRGRRS